jgi:hypothetical protein
VQQEAWTRTSTPELTLQTLAPRRELTVET